MFLGRRRLLALLIGDVLLFYVALIAVLLLRYFPSVRLMNFPEHVLAFSFLIAVWMVIFLAAGLYDKNTLLFRRKLPSLLLKTQLANSFVAVLFFYYLPIFKITPKTNLFLYILISFLLVLLWRMYGIDFLWRGRKQRAILVGRGGELAELGEEINRNPRYNIQFVGAFNLDKMHARDFEEEFLAEVKKNKVSVVVLDLYNEKIEALLPRLYNLLFSGVRFVDMGKLYEEVFDRIPLTLLRYDWFLENISPQRHSIHDLARRVMDIALSLFLGGATLLLLPFIALAIWLDDSGPVFIKQKRVGEGNKEIEVYKFRSMQRGDENGVWIGETDNQVTRAGDFLRKTRLDELPQLWSVLKGDISLIGPRPDITGLGVRLMAEIPYYTIRSIVKPGITGWAQIKQDYSYGNLSPQSVEETKTRLAYDLYYIKNRSFSLDITIALRTIQTLLSRVGS